MKANNYYGEPMDGDTTHISDGTMTALCGVELDWQTTEWIPRDDQLCKRCQRLAQKIT